MTGHIHAWHVWEKMVNSGQGTKQSAGSVGGWREGRQCVTLATAKNLQKLRSKTGCLGLGASGRTKVSYVVEKGLGPGR